MENNMTLQSKNINGATTTLEQLPRILQSVKSKAVAPVEWLRQYYSLVLGKGVTMRQTLRYLHAQCAFVMAVVPAYDSLFVHVCMAIWFAISVARCKQ